MDLLLAAFGLASLGTAASLVAASAGEAFGRPHWVRRGRAGALAAFGLLMFTLTAAGVMSDDDRPSDDTWIAMAFFVIGLVCCGASVGVVRGKFWTTMQLPPPEPPDVPFAGPRDPARVGVRAAPRSALWSTSRYIGRPLRVTAGSTVLMLGAGGLAMVAASRESAAGVTACSLAIILIAVASGFRNPLGSVPAFAGVILAYVGALGGWLSGAVPLLTIATLVLVLEVYWRRDDE